MSSVATPILFTPVQAIAAIKARIQGVWDDPELLKLGPLSIDSDDDLLLIIARVPCEEVQSPLEATQAIPQVSMQSMDHHSLMDHALELSEAIKELLEQQTAGTIIVTARSHFWLSDYEWHGIRHLLAFPATGNPHDINALDSLPDMDEYPADYLQDLADDLTIALSSTVYGEIDSARVKAIRSWIARHRGGPNGETAGDECEWDPETGDKPRDL